MEHHYNAIASSEIIGVQEVVWMHLARILVKPVFENGLYQQPKRLGPVLSQIDLISISIFIFVPGW
jgi:hypothetical protein